MCIKLAVFWFHICRIQEPWTVLQNTRLDISPVTQGSWDVWRRCLCLGFHLCCCTAPFQLRGCPGRCGSPSVTPACCPFPSPQNVIHAALLTLWFVSQPVECAGFLSWNKSSLPCYVMRSAPKRKTLVLFSLSCTCFYFQVLWQPFSCLSVLVLPLGYLWIHSSFQTCLHGSDTNLASGSASRISVLRGIYSSF